MKQIGASDCETTFRNYQDILLLGKRPREKKIKNLQQRHQKTN